MFCYTRLHTLSPHSRLGISLSPRVLNHILSLLPRSCYVFGDAPKFKKINQRCLRIWIVVIVVTVKAKKLSRTHTRVDRRHCSFVILRVF